MTLRFQVRSTQWFSYLTELSTCEVFHTVHRAGHSKKVVEERIALAPRDPVPRFHTAPLPIGWLLKSRLVPVSTSRVTHHKLTPSTQWAFTFYPRCVSLLSSENSDKNMTEANKTVTGKSAMAIGKAIRSQINHRRSSSLQLSNRSARRLQAVCVKLSQAQPQPHKVSLSYKGHGIHNY
jgi:hypothetical protein